MIPYNQVLDANIVDAYVVFSPSQYRPTPEHDTPAEKIERAAATTSRIRRVPPRSRLGCCGILILLPTSPSFDGALYIHKCAPCVRRVLRPQVGVLIACVS